MDNDVFVSTLNIFDILKFHPMNKVFSFYHKSAFADMFQSMIESSIHSAVFRSFYDIVYREYIKSFKNILFVGCPENNISIIAI